MEEEYIEIYDDDDYFTKEKFDKIKKIAVAFLIVFSIFVLFSIFLYTVEKPRLAPTDEVVERNDFDNIDLEDYFPNP